ncbi:MAG TPA: PIN domain-containing protein [Nocardioidaceae bacterium]|nr:PIN domain-containing protein [Nocardioidaceae bacterium]
MTGLTLDTGALIALERRSPRITALLQRASEQRMSLAIPAGVVAQAWRGGGRQARLARLLAAPETEIVSLDSQAARAVGAICGEVGVDDVVDVSVVLCARRNVDRVVTSDRDDIRRIDEKVPIIEV